jgi:hypothetical protein
VRNYLLLCRASCILERRRVLKFASSVSLATTFDGEFSDVTRSYAGKRVAPYAC